MYHPRGINGSQWKLPFPDEFYSKVDDLSYIIQIIKENYSDHKLYAFGSSFGGNILANYLGLNKKYEGIGYIGTFEGHQEVD